MYHDIFSFFVSVEIYAFQYVVFTRWVLFLARIHWTLVFCDKK